MEAGAIVLAAGAWSGALLAPLDIDLPVRPRKRDVFVFTSPAQLPGCGLVIDPAGFWFRPERDRFMCGAPPRDGGSGFRAPGAATLAGFHSIELLRAGFFFYLVTNFDAESTYLMMTFFRIALVAVASLLACSLLRHWVGLRKAEAAAATNPLALAVRASGVICIALAVLRIKGVI